MKTRALIVIVALLLSSLACGVNLTLPDVPTLGPTTTDEINVPAPASGEARLVFSFGAGELSLSPGSSSLVEGTATYDVEDLKPEVVVNGADVEIKHRDLVGLISPREATNKWNFKLGSTPLDLTVNAGAYQGKYELGGLALTDLTIKDGAAGVDLNFSEPNASEMTVFRYETGASQVKMTGLANANFGTMIFGSGAGDYTLDFSGDLKRDATITISTGLSNLTLIVPKNVSASLTVETGLSNISVASSWSRSGSRYVQEGTGPALTFIVQGGAGNITISN